MRIGINEPAANAFPFQITVGVGSESRFATTAFEIGVSDDHTTTSRTCSIDRNLKVTANAHINDSSDAFNDLGSNFKSNVFPASLCQMLFATASVELNAPF